MGSQTWPLQGGGEQTGCCRHRQGLNCSGCNNWGGTRTGLGGRSWSRYGFGGRSLALGCGCCGCWGRTDEGSRLGAGLLTSLQAHPGNDRRAHMRANHGALSPPFIMSLTVHAGRPLIPRIRDRVGPDCPKWGGLARQSPEWGSPACTIRPRVCHNVKIYLWDAWGG